MTNTVIFNACIITMNERMEVIRNGSILVSGECISEIRDGKMECPGATYFDAGGMIVMPGLINTHTHLPMTMLRGFADDLPLHEWLNDHIFPAEARAVTPDNVRVATRLAFIEMLKSGTTCFNDMYFFEDIIAEEARKAGMRGVVGESLIDFPTPSFKSVAEGAARCEELIRQWQGDALVHPGVCAHSPYTCSKETLQTAKQLADKHDVRLHIHVAETRKEVEDVLKSTGQTPAGYLHDIGLLDQNVTAAHAVWLNRQDTELFARAGTSIAHCPKSNLKLGSGVADIAHYMKNGINVSIGTDGAASNNTLDMIEEMRFAALLPKGTRQNAELVNARAALRMATINGAKALGIDHLTGSLEIGKRADLIVLHADASNMIPVYDEFSAIVYAANGKNVRSAMINGKWIMRDRELLTIDKTETMEAVKRIAQNIV